jgi:hypothetical protein
MVHCWSSFRCAGWSHCDQWRDHTENSYFSYSEDPFPTVAHLRGTCRLVQWCMLAPGMCSYVWHRICALTLLLPRLCRLFCLQPSMISGSEHLLHTGSLRYRIPSPECVFYWKEIGFCRLNIRQRLGRCWTWLPLQPEKSICPNMCCPRKILNLYWMLMALSYHDGSSFLCLECLVWKLQFSFYWPNFVLVGDRYLRIVKYKTAYYSFYLPVGSSPRCLRFIVLVAQFSRSGVNIATCCFVYFATGGVRLAFGRGDKCSQVRGS